ncbi:MULTISPECIES: ABC transporter ATP-binding protein [Neptunomonas]|uniref:ABC transporter ATP-binding protein n=1 Tax=Neptunomonas marina TaxID=1815562 RepID=A0A437Q492_9GAMM|nr:MULTISPECIES: ABC transporter ATP-binding protein [Neptunomonas]RVU29348.1 ABC transporter ATP-binding protein [Neptunomonas marina]
MSFIQINQLEKHWQGKAAVDGISFTASKGEFIALLGPSGCGKSTTLKMLAGLEKPDAGQIKIDGHDVTQAAPGKRQLSMVFQSYALFPHLSVTENILFGLKARRVPKDEQQRRLAYALDCVSLVAQADKKPGQLSGGQCQRVALARAIVSQAPICLMDEPLSNLDARLRHEMRSEIRRLQQQLNLTVIYVTHDQIEAMSMADRIILLNNGKIEQIGTPNQLYSQPASRFVAEFIGQPPMNLLVGDEHLVGVRPEHISLATQGVAARAVHTEYQGAETRVEARLETRFPGQMVSFTLPGHQVVNADEHLTLQWPAGQEHYFSHKTGQRLANQTPLLNPHSKDLAHVY